MGLFGGSSKSSRHAMNRYIKAMKDFQKLSSWTPARRKEMMKGIQGLVGQYVRAAKERGARTGAGMGRGGGWFGGEAERARRGGLSMASQALSQTYAPSPMPGVSAGAFQGYQGPGMGDILGQLMGTAGGLGLGKLFGIF